MSRNIRTFVMSRFNLTEEEAQHYSQKYYHNYGLSLLGFYTAFNKDGQKLMSAKEYGDYVHCNVTYTNLNNTPEKKEKNAQLKAMLTRLNRHVCTPQSTNEHQHYLYYFTNANREHAINCLSHIGLLPLFESAAEDGEADAVYSPVARPFKEYAYPFDALTAEENNANHKKEKYYFGFSYEDQWRLTEPNIINKPFRDAYAAVAREIERDVVQEVQLGDTAREEKRRMLDERYSQLYTNGSKELNTGRFIMVDDTLMNLQYPLELGWKAVWLDQTGNSRTVVEEKTATPEKNHNNNKSEEKSESQFITKFSDPFYQTAFREKRLKIIYSILELEGALDEFVAEESKP
ncbi:hypothetical protein AGDE_08413 [Angomonas deanei]|nr:hypothetical protein AGDE_08413 [Angomonas deanei]|eukprot:EPY32978.1 hypothetical protein AGDE_08413 [Angomonas deanei]